MNDILKTRARTLRKTATKAENKLWQLLRNRYLYRYKFKRQYVVSPYIVDFICLSKKLIIELDGGQHMDAQQYDEKRTQFLATKGYKVIRFWNHDVLARAESVIATVINVLESLG